MIFSIKNRSQAQTNGMQRIKHMNVLYEHKYVFFY